jgi:hypothetical protein
VNWLKNISIVLLLTSLATGCAVRDRRDAAWDPPPGRQLFEQIPAWDNAAEKICCSSLLHSTADRKGSREAYQQCMINPKPPRSPRC